MTDRDRMAEKANEWKEQWYHHPYLAMDALPDLLLAVLREERKRKEPYVTAFYAIGAEIAKAGCCDHGAVETDNPNRCTREHLMVKFLELKDSIRARGEE